MAPYYIPLSFFSSECLHIFYFFFWPTHNFFLPLYCLFFFFFFSSLTCCRTDWRNEAEFTKLHIQFFFFLLIIFPCSPATTVTTSLAASCSGLGWASMQKLAEVNVQLRVTVQDVGLPVLYRLLLTLERANEENTEKEFKEGKKEGSPVKKSVFLDRWCHLLAITALFLDSRTSQRLNTAPFPLPNKCIQYI